MKTETASRLLRLNRKFYLDFAGQFSETRTPGQPGLERILPYIPHFCRLLDVGCGNGRLALWLDAKGIRAKYVGVDSSEELLAHARDMTSGLKDVSVEFAQADTSEPNWTNALPHREYDVVFSISLLHHIPSSELRGRLFRDFAELLRPGGLLIVATWQFLASPRMRRKIVPWDRIGLPDDDLEQGDYLLDWKRGGVGYRYCHLVDEGELRLLAERAGLEMIETFRSDGKEGNLNLYGVMKSAS